MGRKWVVQEAIFQRFDCCFMCMNSWLFLWVSLGLMLAPVANSAERDRLAFMFLDSHLDTPLLVDFSALDMTKRYSWQDDYSQVDLPRMKEGGLDGGFWVIYTPQGPLTSDGYTRALQEARQRNVTINKMVSRAPDEFAMALKAQDAQVIIEAGKRVVYKSIENAYPLGEDLNLLDEFYADGVRMIGLVHTRNNQFADSSTDPSGQKWNGLSPLGKELIKRANKLGMIVDLSHAHNDALDQAITLSKSPIILSHSGASALYEHPRNVPDDLLVRLAKAGGVIQINSLSGYLRDLNVDRRRLPELFKIYSDYRTPAENQNAKHRDYVARRQALDSKYPPEYADISDVMDHFFHTLDLLGDDHIGFGLDWDGGGGVTNLQDVSELPNVLKSFRARGLNEKSIAKITGGNLLRLLAVAEAKSEK